MLSLTILRINHLKTFSPSLHTPRILTSLDWRRGNRWRRAAHAWQGALGSIFNDGIHKEQWFKYYKTMSFSSWFYDIGTIV